MSEKIEQFWVNATADDVARVMAGETVEARFRDSDRYDWWTHHLAGWEECSQSKWIDSNASSWVNCQVYREPSWFTDKPDPGPGYRLLGKFPDEELKPGDEGWDVWNDGEWAESDNANDGKPQSEQIWYRRRIEPAEPKFAVGQTVKVVGPKQIPALEWSSVGMAQYAGTTHTVKRVELLTNPPGIYYHLGEIDNWAFREDYLEPVGPEPKHYVLRVGDSFETPSGHLISVVSPGVEQIEFKLKAGFTAKLPNGQTIKATEKGFEVTQ